METLTIAKALEIINEVCPGMYVRSPEAALQAVAYGLATGLDKEHATSWPNLASNIVAWGTAKEHLENTLYHCDRMLEHWQIRRLEEGKNDSVLARLNQENVDKFAEKVIHSRKSLARLKVILG